MLHKLIKVFMPLLSRSTQKNRGIPPSRVLVYNSGILDPHQRYQNSMFDIPEFYHAIYRNYTRIPQEIALFPLESRIPVEFWYISHQILVCDHFNSGILYHQLIYQIDIPDPVEGVYPYFSAEAEVNLYECI